MSFLLVRAALAHKMGINRTVIADYEVERATVHGDILIRFSYELDVSADYLLGITDDPTSHWNKG